MKRILVLSGEASGDRLGAHLVEEIRSRLPDVSFDGIGGEAMERAGVQRIYDSGRIAVTGIVEVLGAFGSIWKAWRTARAHLRSARPDLVVLVHHKAKHLYVYPKGGRTMWRLGYKAPGVERDLFYDPGGKTEVENNLGMRYMQLLVRKYDSQL